MSSFLARLKTERGTKSVKGILVKFPIDMHKQLAAIKKGTGRSMADIVIEAVRFAFEPDLADAGPIAAGTITGFTATPTESAKLFHGEQTMAEFIKASENAAKVG